MNFDVIVGRRTKIAVDMLFEASQIIIAKHHEVENRQTERDYINTNRQAKSMKMHI